MGKKKAEENDKIVNKIFERDIDLLLVEELRCSRDFLELFLSKTDWPKNYKTIEMYHSKYMYHGEADVEVILTYPDGTHYALLIEDKIDAVTQKDQSQRYTENAELIIQKESYVDVKTFLVAPQKYIDNHMNDHNIADFNDRIISYEELIAFFDKPHNDERFRYKADLLRAGIGKQQRQTVKVVDPKITEFWKELREYAKDYKDLRFVSKTDQKNNRDLWVNWYAPEKFKGVYIYWKADHGYIDVQLEKSASREEEFQQKFGGKLLPGMDIKKAGNSIVFRLENPRCWKMDFRHPFRKNRQNVDHVLSVASMIYQFMDTLDQDIFK